MVLGFGGIGKQKKVFINFSKEKLSFIAMELAM